MNLYLEIMAIVFSPEVIAILRRKTADLSLIELREYSAITFEAITDLQFLSEEDLAVGTPIHSALPGAFLDILYGGSSNRPGTFTNFDVRYMTNV